MATIYNFPNSFDREWSGVEATLKDAYAGLPDGLGTLEECLPTIRSHWQAVFTDFSSVQPAYQIPGPLTKAQEAAVVAAVEAGIQLVAKQLKAERNTHFGLLLKCEFNAAYFRRNGILL